MRHRLLFPLARLAFATSLFIATPALLVGLGMNKDWVDAHNIPYTARIVFWVGAVLSFIVLIIVLTLRPSGLLGERVADRA